MEYSVIAAYLITPLLVWKCFRITWLKWGVIAVLLLPVLYALCFHAVLSNCANVPLTSVGRFLDCPTQWQSMFYEAFHLPVSFGFILLVTFPVGVLGGYGVLLALCVVLELNARKAVPPT